MGAARGNEEEMFFKYFSRSFYFDLFSTLYLRKIDSNNLAAVRLMKESYVVSEGRPFCYTSHKSKEPLKAFMGLHGTSPDVINVGHPLL